MNEKSSIAYSQYKDLVTAWGRDVNVQAYENGMQLIQWIEDQVTHSDVQMRQEAKAANWESLLSGFPTKAIRDEITRRIESEAHGTIGSDCPVCPGCGRYMEIASIGNGRSLMWESVCECIIGSEVSVQYQSSREEVIKAQNEAILAYQANNN